MLTSVKICDFQVNNMFQIKHINLEITHGQIFNYETRVEHNFFSFIEYSFESIFSYKE